MTIPIEISISIEGFSKDIHFETKLNSLLNSLSLKSEKKLIYVCINTDTKVEFKLSSNADYIWTAFLPNYKMLVESMNKQTQVNLNKSIRFVYKLTTAIPLREGNCEDLESYLNNFIQ